MCVYKILSCTVYYVMKIREQMKNKQRRSVKCSTKKISSSKTVYYLDSEIDILQVQKLIFCNGIQS